MFEKEITQIEKTLNYKLSDRQKFIIYRCFLTIKRSGRELPDFTKASPNDLRFLRLLLVIC